MCSRTGSVGRMLAHLPDELRNSVPFPFAPGIVELVEVAPGFGRIGLWLLDAPDGKISVYQRERKGNRTPNGREHRQSGLLTAIVLRGATTTKRGKGVRDNEEACGWCSKFNDCAYGIESWKRHRKQGWD